MSPLIIAENSGRKIDTNNVPARTPSTEGVKSTCFIQELVTESNWITYICSNVLQKTNALWVWKPSSRKSAAVTGPCRCTPPALLAKPCELVQAVDLILSKTWIWKLKLHFRYSPLHKMIIIVQRFSYSKWHLKLHSLYHKTTWSGCWDIKKVMARLIDIFLSSLIWGNLICPQEVWAGLCCKILN